MSKTNQQIPIGMTLANCGGQVDAHEVYDFIANQASGTTAYALRPSGIEAAAIDFYLILGAVADIATIASILWLAYDRFIAPKKPLSNDSGIYITVQRPDGTVVDVFLGRDVLSKEDFTHRLELLVGEANDPELRLTHEARIRELENSKSWVRIDRK